MICFSWCREGAHVSHKCLFNKTQLLSYSNHYYYCCLSAFPYMANGSIAGLIHTTIQNICLAVVLAMLSSSAVVWQYIIDTTNNKAHIHTNTHKAKLTRFVIKSIVTQKKSFFCCCYCCLLVFGSAVPSCSLTNRFLSRWFVWNAFFSASLEFNVV